MPKIFDLYCAAADELRWARHLVEAALGIELRAHDSMYWGGTYYLARSTPYGNIAVRPNFNTFTQRLNQSEFPDCRFLVYVDRARDADAAKAKLLAGGLHFLERRTVP